MLEVIYAPSFVRQFKKLEPSLQDEVLEKISLFVYKKNHKSLKAHKLNGRFQDCFSFSINYNTRVVFQYMTKNKVALLSVGDHTVYK